MNPRGDRSFALRPAAAFSARSLFRAVVLALTALLGATSLRAQDSGAGYTFRLLAGTPDRGRGYGSGAGVEASFDTPQSVAVDEYGTVYVADAGNCVIRKITPDGIVTTLAGDPGRRDSVDGLGGLAGFNYPHAVAVDRRGNVYVMDGDGFLIRKITPAGLVSTLAGTAVFLWAPSPSLGVASLAVDSAGNVYAARESEVRKITPAGVVSTLAGVENQWAHVDGPGVNARFGAIQGLAVDGAGNVYVADRYLYTPRKWVVDTRWNTIRKITPDGVVSTIADATGAVGSADGPAAQASFYNPGGLAVDDRGNVYVTDTRNQTIRRIGSDGLVTTLAGGLGSYGYANGVGAAVRFNWPLAIAVDRAGNLYVADTGNHSIRKGVPAGRSQLSNLSTRAFVGTGDNIPIAGFVITGQQPKQVLIRAGGPALASAFGLTGVLADPLLRLSDHAGAEINRNDGWGGDAAIKAAAQRVGAFAWSDQSADSALLVTLVPGLYSAQVSGRSGGTGTAMVEVYDADDEAARNAMGSGRLINLSTRSTVGTGANVQIAGFVIAGERAKQVLIRAGGPILSTAFHMTGVLAAPVLTLCDHNGAAIDQNTGWNSDATAAVALRAAAARVGAYAWPADSADAALLVTLAPGVYTAQVAGKSNGTGTALIEVYDADPE